VLGVFCFYDCTDKAEEGRRLRDGRSQALPLKMIVGRLSQLLTVRTADPLKLRNHSVSDSVQWSCNFECLASVRKGQRGTGRSIAVHQARATVVQRGET